MSPTPSPLGMKQAFACVRCEKHHLEGDHFYAAHWEFQTEKGTLIITEREWAVKRLLDFQPGGDSGDYGELSALLN